MRPRVVGKKCSREKEYVAPAEAPAVPVHHPFVAQSRNVVDAGVTGETGRLNSLSEVGVSPATQALTLPPEIYAVVFLGGRVVN